MVAGVLLECLPGNACLIEGCCGLEAVVGRKLLEPRLPKASSLGSLGTLRSLVHALVHDGEMAPLGLAASQS